MYNLCIFEDTKYKNFLPLTFLRPVYELHCGLDTLLGKIIRYIPHNNVILHCRSYLKKQLKNTHHNALINNFTTAGSCLFVNGRLITNPTILDNIELSKDKDYIYINSQEEIVFAQLSGDNLAKMKKLLESGPINLGEIYQTFRLKATTKKIKASLTNYPLDLISRQKKELNSDFSSAVKGGIIKGLIHPQTYIKQEDQVFIDKNAEIDAFTVLDASEGAIYISPNAYIAPHSYLKGPIFIGNNSQVLGGKIDNSSIGPHCKVSGEISNTIILGYTNKAHAGFLGNMYIGEWVNFGALSCNSNLKNNYKQVKIILDGCEIQTNETFFGGIVADHTKIGIGVLLNTGIIIGVGNNIFGGNMIFKKYIPSFIWGMEPSFSEHKIDKMLNTSKIMLSRRKIKMDDDYKDLLQKIFKLTENERYHFLKD